MARITINGRSVEVNVAPSTPLAGSDGGAPSTTT
jgi:hypothetical protein